MKIIADKEIPYLNNFFGNQGDLIQLPTEKIDAQSIKDADVLFVRSVTPITSQLISNSSVRFIGSATAGTDHMDLFYLNEKGIAWSNAPGCNAKAVADYVLLSVAVLIEQGVLPNQPLRAGVIGVGNVGEQVSEILKKLGFSVVLNDPPRAANEVNFVSTSLDQFYDLDFICLHTPLTKTGDYPTLHLLDQDFLSKLNPRCVLLNAGRGACIDTQALKQLILTAILDVWESEPNIDAELANSMMIATTHIAGYSQPAKYRATKQLFENFCNHFEVDHYINPEEDPSEYVELDILKTDWVKHALEVENLKNLSDAFKKALKENPNNIANVFKDFRKNYRFRPEFNL